MLPPDLDFVAHFLSPTHLIVLVMEQEWRVSHSVWLTPTMESPAA